jgi:hypothetical protein
MAVFAIGRVNRPRARFAAPAGVDEAGTFIVLAVDFAVVPIAGREPLPRLVK